MRELMRPMLSIRWLALAIFAAAVMVIPVQAFGQGCALCYTQAASSGRQMIEALQSEFDVCVIRRRSISWLAFSSPSQTQSDPSNRRWEFAPGLVTVYKGDNSSSLACFLSLRQPLLQKLPRQILTSHAERDCQAKHNRAKCCPEAIMIVRSAMPSTSKAMDRVKMLMKIRTDRLTNRDGRKFAFTAASNAAREKKLAASSPKKRITRAANKRGRKRKNRAVYSSKPTIPSTLTPTSTHPTHATQKANRLSNSVDDGNAPDFWCTGRPVCSRQFGKSAPP